MNKLIFKYLNNELSLNEWKELNDWLEESALNRRTLNNLESYWKNFDEDLDVRRELIWDGLKSRVALAEEEQKLEMKLSRHALLFNYLKVAAIFIIAVTFSFIVFKITKDDSRAIPSVQIVDKTTAPGQKLTTKLPDGSIVTLNSESQISFPENFAADKREVELTGEAYFEVEHDADKPFYVKSNNSVIKVLGTSFNVRFYPGEIENSISVLTGKVHVSDNQGNEGCIIPNMRGVFNLEEKQLLIESFSVKKEIGWKDGFLIFENTAMTEVITTLERWYGVKITVENKLLFKGEYTGNYKNASLEKVLDGISYTTGIAFSINDNDVILYKNQGL